MTICSLLATLLAATSPDVLAFARAFPDPLEQLVLTAAVAWQLNPFVLHALLDVESRLRPCAKHARSGALGIAQLTRGGRAAVTRLRAARGLPGSFRAQDALDPRKSVPASAELLAHHRSTCGSLERGLAAYNTGTCKHRRRTFVLRVLQIANRRRVEAGLPPVPSRHRHPPNT